MQHIIQLRAHGSDRDCAKSKNGSSLHGLRIYSINNGFSRGPSQNLENQQVRFKPEYSLHANHSHSCSRFMVNPITSILVIQIAGRLVRGFLPQSNILSPSQLHPSHAKRATQSFCSSNDLPSCCSVLRIFNAKTNPYGTLT